MMESGRDALSCYFGLSYASWLTLPRVLRAQEGEAMNKLQLLMLDAKCLVMRGIHTGSLISDGLCCSIGAIMVATKGTKRPSKNELLLEEALESVVGRYMLAGWHDANAPTRMSQVIGPAFDRAVIALGDVS